MKTYFVTIVLLLCSNVFMTFAWYAHLKDLSTKPWLVAALASWGIALFEYLLQVPANRNGITVMQLGQLKILQEVIALSVFVPFSILYMKQKLSLDYLWASMCIAAAAYFIFRAGQMADDRSAAGLSAPRDCIAHTVPPRSRSTERTMPVVVVDYDPRRMLLSSSSSTLAFTVRRSRPSLLAVAS